MFGIASLAIIPVRESPKEQSEMVTQLLFGDVYTILDSQGKWTRIKMAFDEYEGWIDRKLIEFIEEDEFNSIANQNPTVIANVMGIAFRDTTPYHLVLGTTLPNFDGRNFGWDKATYKLAPNAHTYYASLETDIATIAISYLNTPYLWGGRTPFGIDCSGFTQMVYKHIGLKLPRDAFEQLELGNLIPSNEVILGDLCFFKNPEGRITHVGMALSENVIIHSSGKVRIDKLDPIGIYNNETKAYTHQLHSIKRII